MAKARGSAIVQFVTLSLLLYFVVQFQIAQATDFTVGDADGWTFGVTGWTNGKNFKVGDVLVFKYDSSFHNVQQVSKAEYDNCKASEGSKTYDSGNDRITLVEGTTYFICGITGHCDGGMKIAVDVHA